VPPTTRVLCRDCLYDLETLPAGACPECGRAFDPDDPSTYAISERRGVPDWLVKATAVMLAWPGILTLCVFALYAIARIELGRWPNTWGADDPRGIVYVRPLYVVTMIGAVATPVFVLLGASCFIFVAWHRPAKGLQLAGLTVVAWMFFYFVGDDVWRWFMD
jgi:hypothetical protein